MTSSETKLLHRRASLTLRALAAVACITAPAILNAAPVIWGTPTAITSNADISSDGPLVHAGNFRNTAGTLNVTNGSEVIAFPNRSAQNALGALQAGEEARVIQGAGGRQTQAALFDATGTTVTSDFELVLDGSAWENSDPGPAPGATDMILRVTGVGGSALTNGQTYQIQLFFSDDRPSSAGRAIRLHDGLGNFSSSFLFSDSPYVIGTFTADATGYQDVHIQNTSGGANFPVAINAYVLRKPATIPVLVGSISISPSNTAYAGEPRVLTATATGPATGYRWEWDSGSFGAAFSTIPGATGLSFTQATTGLLGDYQYRFVATNVSTAVTSTVATLTVSAASEPVLVEDTTPPGVTRYTGGYVTFGASFSGNSSIAYQWQVDAGSGFVNLNGATNSALTLTNLQLANAGSYRLTATNSVGGNASSPAFLTVNDGSLAKFQWSAPVSFIGLNADQILTNLSGSIAGAAVFGTTPTSVTLGNGRILNFKTDGSVATATGIGTATGAFPAGTGLSTSNADFNAVLNQFSWDGGPKAITLNNLQPGETYSVQLFALDNREASSNRLANFQDPADEANVSAQFKMGDNVYIVGTFVATSTSEFIQENLPTDGNGNINALVLRALSFTPPNQPPLVTVEPQPQTVFIGRSASFSVTAESHVIPTYQWQAGPVGGPYTNLNNGGVFSGVSSNILTLTNATAFNAAEFRVIVSNPDGNATSAAALLTVVPTPPGSGAVSAAVLSLGPVAYWQLNETNDPSSGLTGAYDAAGTFDGRYLAAAQNAFNGVVGVQAADGFGMFATNQGALQSTASTDQSWVTTPALNLNTNTVTIGMWIHPAGIQPNAVGLYVNRNAGTIAGLGYFNNDRLGYKWNNDAAETWSFNSGLLIPTDTWSFVAVVVEPAQATLYLYNTNGLLTATNVTAHTNMSWAGSQASIRIGSDNSAGTTFNGKIDEVMVFKRALSPAEINQLIGLSAPVEIQIQRVGSSVQLTWPSGSLLEAIDITGPWTTNQNTSPYLLSPSEARKFFRVKVQ